MSGLKCNLGAEKQSERRRLEWIRVSFRNYRHVATRPTVRIRSREKSATNWGERSTHRPLEGDAANSGFNSSEMLARRHQTALFALEVERISKLLGGQFRIDGIDEAVGTPFESCDFRQPRKNLQPPMVTGFPVLMEWTCVKHEVVGRLGMDASVGSQDGSKDLRKLGTPLIA